MRTVDRVRLVIIMAVAGLNGIMSGVKLIGDLIQHDEFRTELLIVFIHVFVIFWLAAEVYGLRLKLTEVLHKNTKLTRAVAARTSRFEDDQL